MVSSSSVEMTRKTLEDESTTLSGNVGNKVLDTATHPKRIDTSELISASCGLCWTDLDQNYIYIMYCLGFQYQN